MAVAIIVALVLLASILFTAFSPWWFSPLASNWGTIDDTLVITFWITGIVAIAVISFTVIAIWKYHHKPGQKADYEPENKKLEWWLTVLTAIGVAAMLAPGLVVWNTFITVPEEADVVEAVGEQWKWTFRFPGEDGEFGTVGVHFMSFDNPFGMNPDDPKGQDDVLIFSPELHLPLDRPVKMLLRSKDVLHDFYVPHFRAKMDLVPGQVTYFWFTPTREGKFDLLCAELCGVGHFNMRGHVVIEDSDSHAEWLAGNPTYAETVAAAGEVSGSPFELGRQVAGNNGCFGCHSVDGTPGIGPTWRGLFGKTETLDDGSQVLVDEDFLRESITDPNATIIEGYQPIMPAYDLSEEDMQNLLIFIRTDAGAQGVVTEEMESHDEAEHEMEMEGAADAAAPDLAGQGRELAASLGCTACHSFDGSPGLGPTWQGLMGRSTALTDGSTITVDEDYLRESITDPNAKVVEGSQPMMPPYNLSDEEMNALLAFLMSEIE